MHADVRFLIFLGILALHSESQSDFPMICNSETVKEAEVRSAQPTPHPLERFSNSRALSGDVQGGLFFRKKPLDIVPSMYSNWRTAIGATHWYRRSMGW